MGRSRRGSGSVFQRTYRDAKGRNRKTANWYIEFVAGNRTIREATGFTNRTDAAESIDRGTSAIVLIEIDWIVRDSISKELRRG